jgi:hypothetical protein
MICSYVALTPIALWPPLRNVNCSEIDERSSSAVGGRLVICGNASICDTGLQLALAWATRVSS